MINIVISPPKKYCDGPWHARTTNAFLQHLVSPVRLTPCLMPHKQHHDPQSMKENLQTLSEDVSLYHLGTLA